MRSMEEWRRELEEARARALRLVDEREEASDLAARWSWSDDALIWQVEIGAAVEPDVDLEEVGDAIVVRVRRSGALPPGRAVVAAPRARAVAAVAVAFHDGALEVRFLLEER